MESRDYALIGVVVALSLFLTFVFFEYRFGCISGFSMYPSLCDGDFIALRGGTVALSVGDVIGYDPGGPGSAFIAHRVYSVYPLLRYVLAKGDNPVTNPWADPIPIYASQIVGKVVFRYRFFFR